MIIKKLQALFHPEQYHGWGRSKKYFEGWYYKVVNAEENRAFAFIPGIAMDENSNKQAFVQVLDGINKTAKYHRFEASEFIPTAGAFDVTIQKNRFKRNAISLELPGISGQLEFHNQVPWPSSWYSPGIMGPYSFVPFMQCYHGIVSMDHNVSGQLTIQNEKVDFTGGRGYMEKDWGSSFPSGYIWMQSNHFSEAGISLKSSVANIPWLASSFVGFIAGIWLYDRLIPFTTYNGTKLKKSFADEKKVELVMENKNYLLEIEAERDTATSLASPIQGFMDGRIEESMTAKIMVKLKDKRAGKVLLEDTGRNAGLEVAGNVEDVLVGGL
jgi:hypothetical protein